MQYESQEESQKQGIASPQSTPAAGPALSKPPSTRLPVWAGGPVLQRKEDDQINAVAHAPAPAVTPAVAGTPQPMTRVQFDAAMKTRYRVAAIKTGSFQDQAFGEMKQTDWNAWSPGTSSMVYNWIIDAFANFEKAFGGMPPVKEVVFFDVRYQRDDQGKPVKDTSTGASYGVGQLTIYRAVQQGNQMFDVQSALKTPTSEQAVTRNITHELGHGIAETALNQRTDQPPGADPDLFKDYRRAVGWTDDGKLYDIQEQAVQNALKTHTSPPAEFQITPKNATTTPWKERPLTSYMATNPSEDFAEAVMAYVNEPQSLKVQSPARYQFIHQRKARWLASGQPKMNIWERAARGSPRTLQPSRKPTIWDRVLEAQ